MEESRDMRPPSRGNTRASNFVGSTVLFRFPVAVGPIALAGKVSRAA